jgi:hypothetical protein
VRPWATTVVIVRGHHQDLLRHVHRAHCTRVALRFYHFMRYKLIELVSDRCHNLDDPMTFTSRGRDQRHANARQAAGPCCCKEGGGKAIGRAGARASRTSWAGTRVRECKSAHMDQKVSFSYFDGSQCFQLVLGAQALVDHELMKLS